MAIGQSFTVTTKFETSSGRSFEGKTVVPAPATGNNVIEIDVEALADDSELPLAAAVDKTKLKGYGFKAVIVDKHGAGGTPQVTIRFKNAKTGPVDLEYVLTDGQSVAIPHALELDLDADSVQVFPDPTADFRITGAIVVVP